MQLERARVDALRVVHGPGVERVAGREVVGELGAQRVDERLGQRREREAGGLGVVGEERRLAARLGHGADPHPARAPFPAERLERLDQVGEVVHLDYAVGGEHGREGPVGADERAGVSKRHARPGLRAPDLEADDRLAGRPRNGQAHP